MNKRSFASRPNRLSVGRLILRPYTAAAIIVLASALIGCFSGKITRSREEFYAGDYPAAADVLLKIKDKKGKNRILALMEYGIALHAAGKYLESADTLLEANRLIELNDIIHAGQLAGSMVTNEMLTTFRPEGFERVLVHTYLAMNFIMLDDWIAARVEAKQALKALGDLDPQLQAHPFTRYVCGLAFEVNGDLADAYIEYKLVARASPGYLPIYYELHRLAAVRGMRQEALKWAREIKKRGGNVPADIKAPNLIVFVGAGRSPVKREINIFVPPHTNRFVVPEYVSSGSRAHHAVLSLGKKYKMASFVLTDLDPLATLTLKKRIAKEIAKETLRVSAKEAIASQIEEQNELAGLLVRLVFFASEAADVRSWETLPRHLGAITGHLPPGKYDITVKFYTKKGTSLDTVTHQGVTITEGRRTFLSVRSVQ